MPSTEGSRPEKVVGNKETGKRGLVMAASRGGHLTKAPYEMLSGRLSCAMVGVWVGAVLGQAGGRL